MSLKIKVVETKVSAKGDYRAIVRVLRYEDAMEALKSLCKPEELIEFEKVRPRKLRHWPSLRLRVSKQEKDSGARGG